MRKFKLNFKTNIVNSKYGTKIVEKQCFYTANFILRNFNKKKKMVETIYSYKKNESRKFKICQSINVRICNNNKN